MRRNHSNVNTVIGVLWRLLSRPTFIERLIRQVLQIGHVWKNLKNELTQTNTPTLILKIAMIPPFKNFCNCPLSNKIESCSLLPRAETPCLLSHAPTENGEASRVLTITEHTEGVGFANWRLSMVTMVRLKNWYPQRPKPYSLHWDYTPLKKRSCASVGDVICVIMHIKYTHVFTCI